MLWLSSLVLQALPMSLSLCQAVNWIQIVCQSAHGTPQVVLLLCIPGFSPPCALEAAAVACPAATSRASAWPFIKSSVGSFDCLYDTCSNIVARDSIDSAACTRPTHNILRFALCNYQQADQEFNSRTLCIRPAGRQAQPQHQPMQW